MRNKKAKKELNGPVELVELVHRLASCPEHELSIALDSVSVWNWPRTDLQCWIDVLNRFDEVLERLSKDYALSTIQANPFTPKTKELTLSILRFTRLLFEHATNRKIFSSYDRLNDLYQTSDLDVLEATLDLALRPAQQYRRSDKVAQERLLQLVHGFRLRDASLDLARLADPAYKPVLPADAVRFQYYKTEGASGQGLATISLRQVTDEQHVGKSDVEMLAQLLHASTIPPLVQLALLQRLRMVRNIADAPTRCRLFALRYTALSILCSLADEALLQSQVFVHEAELVQCLTDLIHPDHDINGKLRAASLRTLESLSRLRGKTNEVLTAVNIAISHGILMQVVRRLVAAIVDSQVSYDSEVMDALFAFVTSIQGHHSHVGGALIGAGIAPLMVQLVADVPLDRVSAATRAILFLETALYASPNAATAFFGANGLATYISKTQAVVRAVIQATSAGTTEMTQNESAFLKSSLRAVARMMANNNGADAMRNLVDTALPSIARQIIEHRSRFGPQIYSLGAPACTAPLTRVRLTIAEALNIITTFVHNEPTSLNVLQEKGLPAVIYASMEAEGDISVDVISAVPNAIGALCLNDAGLLAFRERAPKVFATMCSVLTSDRYARVLAERENASMFGITVEELMRHHPTLKPFLVDAISEQCKSARGTAAACQPDPVLDRDQLMVVIDNVPDATDLPSPGPSKAVSALSQHLDVICKFLEGVCQGQGNARELMKTAAIEDIVTAASTPSIALRHEINQSIKKSLATLLRVISDAANAAVLTLLVKLLRGALVQLRSHYAQPLEANVFDALPAPYSSEDADRANSVMVLLYRAHSIMAIFEAVVPHITYTQSRGVMSSALSVLCAPEDNVDSSAVNGASILEEAAHLARCCTWEAARLHAGHTTGPGPSTTPGATFSTALVNSPLTPLLERVADLPVAINEGEIPEQSYSVTRRAANSSTLRRLLRAIPASYRTVFTALIARPPPRRAPDAAYKTEARKFAELAGRILVSDLAWPESNADYAPYGLLAVKATAEAVSRERWATGIDTSLAIVFDRCSGIDRVIALYRHFADLCSNLLGQMGRDGPQRIFATLESQADPAARLRLLQAVSGLRVCLELLAKLVSRRILPDGIQGSATSAEHITPQGFLRHARSRILPAVTATWEASILESLPPANVQLLFHILLSVLEGDGEKASQWAASAQSNASAMPGVPGIFGIAPVRQPFQIDAARVQQVMDMGFPRGAAEHALRRYHNNANAAAEYLLQHPEVVAVHTVASASDSEMAVDPANARESGSPLPNAASGTSGEETAASHDAHGPASDSATNAALMGEEDLETSALASARAVLGQSFLTRAIDLLSTFPQLVFDIREACKLPALRGVSGLARGVELIAARSVPESFSEPAAAPLAAQMRLIAVLTHDPAFAEDVQSCRSRIMAAFVPFIEMVGESPLPGPELPTWLASALLVLCALLSLADVPNRRDADDPSDADSDADFAVICRGPAYDKERRQVFDVLCRVLRSGARDHDTWSAVLRASALLTQRAEVAMLFTQCNLTAPLLRHQWTIEGHGCQDPATMVLRHVIEGELLVSLFRKDIEDFLRPQRNSAVDVTTLVTGLKHDASRDPVVFIRILTTLATIQSPDATLRSAQITLLDASVKSGPSGGSVGTGADGETQPTTNTLAALVEAMVDCLHQARLPASARPEGAAAPITAAARSDTAVLQQAAVAQAQPGRDSAILPSELVAVRFYLGCLIELLNSHASCKVAFMRSRVADEPTLRWVIEQLIPYDALIEADGDAALLRQSKQLKLGEWSSLLIAALCADIGVHQPQSPHMPSLRSEVVTALIAALRQAVSVGEKVAHRYARLAALADVCLRLAAPAGIDIRRSGRQTKEEIHLDMAKIMVELDLAGALCSAIAEVDLDYPGVDLLVNRLTRPLQVLSRVVGRVGPVQSDSPSKEAAPVLPSPSLGGSGDESEGDGSEDDEGGDDRTMSPSAHSPEPEDDPYRNSALGMYDGELEPSGMQLDYHSNEEHGLDGSNDDMEPIDDGGPAPIVPSDESSDEGDPRQGFREDSSSELDEDDELDPGDDDNEGVVDHGPGFREDEEDDEDIDDDESDGYASSIEDASLALPPARLGVAGDEVPVEGVDDLANQLATQLDDMHAGILGSIDPEGLAEAPDNLDLETDSDAEMREAEEEDDDEGERIEIDLPDDGGALLGGAWDGPGLPVDYPDDIEAFGRARPGRLNAPRIIGGIGSSPLPRDNLREVAQHALLVNDSQQPAESRAQRSGAGRGYGQQVRDPRIQDEDGFGQGTFALLEHFMQGLGGRGLAGILGGGGLHNADIVIETRDGAVRHRSRLLTGGARDEVLDGAPQAPSAPASVTPPFLTPASTALRWDQEARLLQACVPVADRLRLLAEHIVPALRPAARVIQREQQDRLAVEADRASTAVAEKDAPVASSLDAALTAPSTEDGEPRDASPNDAMPIASGVPADPPESAAGLEEVIRLAQSLAPGSNAVSTADGATNEAAISPDAPATRVTIVIHGRAVDITDTGIDPTFLEALPDDMREEIVNQHRRESRSAAANANAPAATPSTINSEFLDALPPAIRAEVLQQEALEQMRQSRQQAAANTGEQPTTPPRAPAEMDAASFLATIEDPTLRESIMLEHLDSNGDDFTATLPSHLAAEVQRLQARLSRQRRSVLEGVRSDAARMQTPSGAAEANGRKFRREIVQLLDKPGVATLLRLLFTTQSLDQSLINGILVNLCAHEKTRVEVLVQLLHVLHDGTQDVRALERSFGFLSGRASRSTATPRAAERTPSAEHMNLSLPTLVAQRCLDALVHLVDSAQPAAAFFLAEQDSLVHAGRRSMSSRKAKGKERDKQTIVPIVLILDLLDRPTILASQNLVEAITSLLSSITRSLLTMTDSANAKAASAPQSAVPAVAGWAGAQILQSAATPHTADSAGDASDPPSATSTSVATAGGAKAAPALTEVPDMPPGSLGRLLNVLDGECSSRTFQQTLATIQHLSTLPGALESLTRELVSKAQRYAVALLDDLHQLHERLGKSTTSTDLSALIMARFSSASAHQTKFLRVLKTLDYMHTKSAKSGDNAIVSQANLDQPLARTFGELELATVWQLVGECLALIEDRGSFESAATALLPVVEALLVVSKPLLRGAASPRGARESLSPSLSGEVRVPREGPDALFLKFARRHRKLLNMFVRNNPSLVSGSFSVLVQITGVLDFEAKRNYFISRLHKGAARSHSTLPLNIRRAYLFEDTFQALHRRSANEIKFGRLSIRFYNEEGVDAGGLTRDWATQLVKRIFNPDYALFAPSSSDALVWQPNPQSYVNPDHLAFFAFVGRIIAKFVYDNRLLDAFFCRSFYKHLLGIPVSVSDLESVDPDSYRSLTWMLDNDIDGVLDLTFSVETDAFGVNTTVDLKPNGREIAVTNGNKREYVELVATHRLTLSISDQINAFVTGFTDIIPRDLVSIFSPQELQLLISGLPDIDADEWRAATDYAGGLTAASPSVTWFWRAVRSMSQEERAKLLQFATGSSRVPLEGFGALQGVSGVTRFTIVGAHTTDALPSAHTCFNQLDLPNYSSYEALREKLVLAISETAGFGFA